MAPFSGFPSQALDFYVRLEQENTREFWQGNKATYDACVREPMAALLDELAGEFGEGSVFRPQRDIRFSRDKSPYKTYQGGFAALFPGTGYYVHLDSTGLLAGAGFHAHDPAQVDRFRAAVDEPHRGEQLAAVVAALVEDGFEVGGEAVRTKPRGFAADHPRIGLLRHKALTMGRSFGSPGWLASPEALTRVRDTWREVRPLNEWLAAYVGPAE